MENKLDNLTENFVYKDENNISYKIPVNFINCTYCRNIDPDTFCHETSFLVKSKNNKLYLADLEPINLDEKPDCQLIDIEVEPLGLCRRFAPCGHLKKYIEELNSKIKLVEDYSYTAAELFLN